MPMEMSTRYGKIGEMNKTAYKSISEKEMLKVYGTRMISSFPLNKEVVMAILRFAFYREVSSR